MPLAVEPIEAWESSSSCEAWESSPSCDMIVQKAVFETVEHAMQGPGEEIAAAYSMPATSTPSVGAAQKFARKSISSGIPRIAVKQEC